MEGDRHLASPRYALGLGLLWSWGYVAHHTQVMLFGGATSEQLDWRYLCWLAVGIAWFALVALRDRGFTVRLVEKRGALLACSLISCAATAALPFVLADPVSSAIVGGAAEIGTCALFLGWGTAFSLLKPKRIRPTLQWAAVAIAAVTIASQLVPDAVAYAVAVAAPLLSASCLPRDAAERLTQARIRFVPARKALRSLGRFLLTVFFYGMPFGYFRFVLLQDAGAGPIGEGLAFFAGLGLGALGLIAYARCLGKRADVTAAYKTALPVTVLALLMLVLTGAAKTLASPILLGVGLACFDTITWILLASVVARTRISPVLSFSFMLAISWAGTLVGVALGIATRQGSVDPLVAPIAIVVCLVAAGTTMFGRLNMLTLDVAEGDAASTGGRAAQAPEGARGVAERFGLTPRENEILGYLLAGRSRAYIEEALVLSKSTVKTHVRHIYEKTGVHSQQELLDLAADTGKPRS